MRNRLSTIILGLAFAVPAFAQDAGPGDPAAGQAKAAVCGACHMVDGNSVDPQYPKLAAQHESYIVRQLTLFKNGERANAIMLGFSAGLTTQDMHDIGAYFAQQAIKPGMASEEKIPGLEETFKQRGERLWRGGDKARGIPACMACHGPAGTGNPGSAYPHLAGQHANYTKAKLLAYRGGEVWGTAPNAAIMPGVAANLDDNDIEALASYIEGLHHVPSTPAGAPAR
jgi:cytochrome c553